MINIQKIGPLWNEREKYRENIDNKNSTLLYLLEKGNDAIQTMIDQELEASGAGEGKKKKKK